MKHSLFRKIKEKRTKFDMTNYITIGIKQSRECILIWSIRVLRIQKANNFMAYYHAQMSWTSKHPKTIRITFLFFFQSKTIGCKMLKNKSLVSFYLPLFFLEAIHGHMCSLLFNTQNSQNPNWTYDIKLINIVI